MTTPRVRTPAAVLAALVVLVAAAGCGSGEPESVDDAFPVFAEPQDDLDVLPGGFDAMDLTGYDLPSSRFVGSDGVTTFYLAKQVDPDGVARICLAALAPDGPSASCTTADTLTLTKTGFFVARLSEPPADDIEGWIAISDYVIVEK